MGGWVLIVIHDVVYDGQPSLFRLLSSHYMLFEGNVTAFRATLWTNLEKLMNAIFGEYQKMTNLEMVMEQRNSLVDPLQDVSDAINEAKTKPIVREFWTQVVQIVGKQFQVPTLSPGPIFLGLF